jgi:hypothetical protein
VTCRNGHETFSSYWVGIGGFGANSKALEQTGTEVDCNLSGKVISTAWYELVPAASAAVRLRVNPGDLMRASVTVLGTKVTIRLDDVTRHRGFHKTLDARVLDISSAEWITEAPSQCVSLRSCTALPLADFASASFDSATAQSIAGHSGAIVDPQWRWTKITLTPGGRRFAAYQGLGPSAGAATPTSLRGDGHSFAVNWALASTQGVPDLIRRTAIRSTGSLAHPVR